MTLQQTEADYLASIRAAYQIDARGELWYAMTQLAVIYIGRDWTQTAADVLAFVLLQDDLSDDVQEQAFERFDDLERCICPRVILDAKAFAEEVDLPEMIEYLLAEDLPN